MDVVGAEELHAHDGEDEDDDHQDKAEVAQSTERSADNAHQQVERRPRLGQLEHAQLGAEYTTTTTTGRHSVGNVGTVSKNLLVTF